MNSGSAKRNLFWIEPGALAVQRWISGAVPLEPLTHLINGNWLR
jgi:hypothetical protein